MNKHITKENTPTANKYTQKWSTSAVIRKMQIKTTMRNHYTLTGMAKKKKTDNTKYRQGCGETETLIHCWWECKIVQTLWKTISKFLIKVNKHLHMTQQFNSQEK